MRAVWQLAISVLLIVSPLLSGFCFGQDWQQYQADRSNIKVWLSEQQPYNLVRAETRIKAPLANLLALIQDPASQIHWLPYAQQVSAIERVSNSQTLVHFQSQGQCPFKPRDAVTLFEVSLPQANQVRIDMENQPDAIAAAPDHVRIQQSSGHWQLSAEQNCVTLLRYQAGSRLGGAIPQWLVNKMNRDLAIEALHNLSQWAPLHYSEYKAYDLIEDIPLSHAIPLHKDCH